MSDSGQSDGLLAEQRPVFATTHWSVVLEAGGGHSTQASVALENLCRTYWYPLYAFLRGKGHTEADAKDLTQGFFAQLLERKAFQTVDARKGKFRTFLLASLGHYLSNERDYTQAAKRGGGQTIISFDEITAEQRRRLEPGTDLSPDKLFDQRWAMRLLEEAVARLREEMEGTGKSGQFELLKAFLTTEAISGEYAAAAERLGITNQAVAVTVHRMRQRYRELVRVEVANTVSSPLEIDDEMRHLFAALSP